jgi:hypothetical protein
MGQLAPRLKLDLAARTAALRRVIAAPLIGVGERGKRLKRLLMQLLALDERPLLERRAIG